MIFDPNRPVGPSQEIKDKVIKEVEHVQDLFIGEILPFVIFPPIRFLRPYKFDGVYAQKFYNLLQLLVRGRVFKIFYNFNGFAFFFQKLKSLARFAAAGVVVEGCHIL